MSDIQIGSLVKIVKSPYSDVSTGEVAFIEEIRRDHFAKGQHLYVTFDHLKHRLFRAHELRLFDDRDN